jgi:Spy/CpxP family protein refolding chaperone
MRHLWLFVLAAGMATAQVLPQSMTQPSLQSRYFLSARQSMEGMLQGGYSGRWWSSPQVAQRVGLTPDQQKRMDGIFQESRLKLIDLTAALDKEEAVMEPLVEADQPDAAKIRSQIDRIAQARSELEKANANFLLGIRMVLTPAQWKELRSAGVGPRPARLHRPDGDTPPGVPKVKK